DQKKETASPTKNFGVRSLKKLYYLSQENVNLTRTSAFQPKSALLWRAAYFSQKSIKKRPPECGL
ncbi:hypothetical protein, partial [Companilactobacillus suantsaicola]|uniref:hypothetical protein n=1 Tax=Companilactobacillus suantsaicola TaxID=2487723 RepID=UPI001C55747C